MKSELKEDNETPMLSGSNSLQSLSSITAALGTGAGGDRICEYIFFIYGKHLVFIHRLSVV